MTDISKRLATRKQVQNLIKAAGIKHFTVDEVLVKTSSTSDSGVKNSMPPVGLIYNCIPTLLLLDAFRAKLNDRVFLLSGFRSDEYNESIGGAELSSHKDFRAYDFTADSGTPDEWAKMLDEMRGMPFPCPVMMDVVAGVGPFRPDLLRVNNTLQGSAFIFHGGINAYNTFCHVDTRGIDVTW